MFEQRCRGLKESTRCIWGTWRKWRGGKKDQQSIHDVQPYPPNAFRVRPWFTFWLSADWLCDLVQVTKPLWATVSFSPVNWVETSDDNLLEFWWGIDSLWYHHKILAMSANHLNQGSENFFCKGSNNKYFKHCGLFRLCCNYLTLPLWQQSGRRQNVNR